mmetsp:Transcript_53495/g.121983  ORF Transcript_53495/g.121983 Transcript_53495/m.121983 type:complete len:441 (-) Transcript_53495:274-1596(-)
MSDVGLRRRGGGDPAHNSSIEEKPVEKMSKLVRKFDMYAKVKEEYRETAPVSVSGGYLTLAAWVLTAMLTLSEVWTYATGTRLKEKMLVDTTLGQKLRINVNITFPALSCLEVHVDAMDVAGDYHPYMEANMHKQRLGGDGGPLGRKVAERANVVETKDLATPKDYCGSCYGAEAVEGDCCNTCDTVMQRYAMKGWATKEIRRDAEQCKREAKNPLAGALKGEGCNLSGFMLVNKVAGNFHVALGESVVRDGRFIHQFQPDEAPGFNTSHVVHSLSFGDPYPGSASKTSGFDPMAGLERINPVEQGTGLYQYFIKLVPTIYDAAGGKRGAEGGGQGLAVWSNQYSYTERFRPLAPHLGGKEHHGDGDHNKHGSTPHHPAPTTVLPGVFWVYDLSAFMLEITQEETTTFTHFLARLCAVAGGVFTVTGLLHSLYGHALKAS